MNVSTVESLDLQYVLLYGLFIIICNIYAISCNLKKKSVLFLLSKCLWISIHLVMLSNVPWFYKPASTVLFKENKHNESSHILTLLNRYLY